MEILKFESGKNAPRRSQASQKNKTIRLAVAIGAVALVGVLSSTLAANISINSGSNVEFGQGVSGAAACDANLTITPGSSFQNTGGSTGTFNLGSITVNDSATTSSSTSGLAACAGKYIRLAAYDSSTATPLTIASGSTSGTGYSTIELYIASASTAPWIQGSYIASPGATGSNPSRATVGSGYPIYSLSSGSGTSNIPGNLLITLGTASGVATSGQIYKITVESHS